MSITIDPERSALIARRATIQHLIGERADRITALREAFDRYERADDAAHFALIQNRMTAVFERFTGIVPEDSLDQLILGLAAEVQLWLEHRSQEQAK